VNTTVILIIVAIVVMVAMHAVSHGLHRVSRQRSDAVDTHGDDTKHADSEGSGGHGHGCC
jgi:uncharacterized protein HemY